jgi:hypothetical protein
MINAKKLCSQLHQQSSMALSGWNKLWFDLIKDGISEPAASVDETTNVVK